MYILVIDLSYQSGTVFILNETLEVVEEREAPHSQNLPLIIQELTKNGERKLDAVAIPKGPGNFTPLRLATTIALALCRTLNIPLITYSPFLNQVPPDSKEGTAYLDARSNLSFQTSYSRNEANVKFSPTVLVEKNCDTPYKTCKRTLGYHVINLFKSQEYTALCEVKISYVKQPR